MKVAKHEIRKRRKMEKLWKRGKNKPVFGKMFLPAFLSCLLTAFIVSTLGTFIAIGAYSFICETIFNDAVDVIEDSLVFRYQKWKERYHIPIDEQSNRNKKIEVNKNAQYIDSLQGEETLLKNSLEWALYGYLFYSDMDKAPAVALYNVEDKSLYCDNKKKVWLYRGPALSPDGLVRTYQCPKEYFEKVLPQLETYNADLKEEDMVNYNLRLQEVYIQGGSFLPGKADIVKTDVWTGEDVEVVQSYDLTPENTDGYTFYSMKSESWGAEYGYATIVGIEENDPNQKNMEQFLSGEALENDSWWSQVGDDLYEGNVTCYASKRVHLDENVEKQLFVTARYNLFDDYGCWIYLGYGVIFLLTILIAVGKSYRKYTAAMTQYQIDTYRRETTNAMAHDLKSPLTAVYGFAENLKNHVHVEKQDYYVDAIIENVQYMDHLIDHILELSKAESMISTTKKEEVDLKPLLQGQIDKQMALIKERKLEVNLSGSGSICADELSMTQIADNLISNAVKYTKQGGQIKVSVTEKGFKVVNEMDGELEIPVDEIWKPFIKGDDSRSGRQGTGIGLTIVKNLVEQQGFHLWLKVEEDTFVAEIY